MSVFKAKINAPKNPKLGSGSVPDPAGVAYSASQTPYLDLRGLNLLLRGAEGRGVQKILKIDHGFETVGHRTRPVGDQKIGLGLGLAGFVLCCEVRYYLVTFVVIMILEDTAAFQVLFVC